MLRVTGKESMAVLCGQEISSVNYGSGCWIDPRFGCRLQP